MNLADLLCYADIHQLNKIARSYSCECKSNSKNELIQAILCAISRKESFEKTVGELSIEDIRFLNTLLFESKPAYSLEDLTARARQSRFDLSGEPGDKSREMIAGFKTRGWLFNGVSRQNRFLFHIPNDVKSKLCEALTRKFSAVLRKVEDPPAYRDEQQLIADDILFFLRYVDQEEVPLTTDGAIYKRSLQQLLDGFAVREQPPAKGGWRFGYGRKFRDYPDRFSLIYDYCYYQDFIREEEGRLTLSESGRERAHSRRKEDLLQIYRFWLRLYKGPIPNLPALVNWVKLLAVRWITLDSLRECLVPLIKPYYYDSPESILEHRIVRMMAHLGLLRIGEHPDFGLAVQATPLADPTVRGVRISDEEMIRLPERLA